MSRIAEDSVNNRIRKLLTKPVEQEDSLTIRFAKYFFSKCMDRGEKK